MIPGWPYSFVVALESGPTSWTAILDAVRLPPGADVAAIAAAQLREVVERLLAAWDRLHPKLAHRYAWVDRLGDLPVIEGTVIRLTVDHLPSGGDPKPVWLWWSKTDATAEDVDRCWMSFLRLTVVCDIAVLGTEAA